MVKVTTRTSSDADSFEPANSIKVSDSGALEVHHKQDDDDQMVAAFAAGEWVKATVDA